MTPSSVENDVSTSLANFSLLRDLASTDSLTIRCWIDHQAEDPLKNTDTS